MTSTKILVIFVTMLAIGCATAPHEKFPGTLPDDLPSDEYIAFDDEGNQSFLCKPVNDRMLQCESSEEDAIGVPPTRFFQDGLFVEGPEFRTPLSGRAPPLATVEGTRTYDVVVHVTRDHLLLNGEELVDLDEGRVHPRDKRGDFRSLFIETLYQELEELRATSDTVPSIVLVPDQMTRYRLFTEVIYTVGQARYFSESRSTFPTAVRRQQHVVWVSCVPNEEQTGELMCHVVDEEGKGEVSVRAIKLVTVGISAVVLPRLEGPRGNKCDWQYVSKVVHRANPELEACVAHLAGDYETLDFNYRVDETEGIVVEGFGGMETSSEVRQCVRRALSKLKIDTSKGQGCVFGSSIPIPLDE